MLKNLILFVPIILFLAACNNNDNKSTIEVNKVITEKPELILPEIPEFKARQVEWIIITPSTAQEEFNKLSQDGKKTVFVAVTENGYRSVVQNLADLQAIVAKQNVIIGAYKNR